MLNHGSSHREALLDEALEETIPASDPLGLREVLAFAMTLGDGARTAVKHPRSQLTSARLKVAFPS
jgi:hypothetical protein